MAKKAVAAIDEPRFTRSLAAQRSGYSIKTLLDLELTGLLKPTRDSRGARLYSQADIDLLIKRRERVQRVRAAFADE